MYIEYEDSTVTNHITKSKQNMAKLWANHVGYIISNLTNSTQRGGSKDGIDPTNFGFRSGGVLIATPKRVTFGVWNL